MTKVLVIIFGLILLIALFARRRYAAALRAGRTVQLDTAMTGAAVAREILTASEVKSVEVCERGGVLGDCYDAGRRTVFLRSETYHGTSAAAVGVAAHEAGHAIQQRDAFTPLVARLTAIRFSQIAAGLVLLAVLVGAFARVLSARVAFGALAIAWGAIMAGNLVTLPVEFDATRRVLRLLEKRRLFRDRDQAEAVARVVKATGIREVGAMLVSLPYLGYHMLPFFGRKSKNRS